MDNPVYILGGAQSDFSTNWTKSNRNLFDLFSHTIHTALEEAKIDPVEIEVGHVGNFVAELFTGQGMLGGWFGHVDERLAGIPTSRHEGACASGSLALLAAMADIQAGHYDLACVAGIELMRNVPGEKAANYLGAAAWVGKEAQTSKYVWPAMFSDLAQAYDDRYGLNHDHLFEISRINYDNASRNPNAQSRKWQFTDKSFSHDDEANPVIEGWMRRHDCAQVTDGAAVVFLASETKARAYAKSHNIPFETLPRIDGWGHTTAPMLLETKLNNSQDKDYILPWTRKAITDAFTRAGINGPDELDLVETHDCFSITEYMAIEHFGITAPGEGWKAVEEGRIAMDGDIPFNPSGGLIGLGHPVGATGVRMLLDVAKQVTNHAGDYQVEGARTGATYNVGGSGTTNCSFIVRCEQ